MLLIIIDPAEQTKRPFINVGAVSSSAVKSFIKNRLSSSLRATHKVSIVRAMLINLKYFASFPLNAKTKFNMANITAKIPNANHLANAPYLFRTLSQTNFA